MKRRFIFTLLVFMSLQFSFAKSTHNGDGNGDDKKEVKVSWYGKEFHGKKTASGEKYNMNALTAAHKTLPFGTKVKITNVRTNKSVIVRINDRGPFVKGRKFDLSKAAFHQIAAKDRGVITVNYEIL
ncbi:septal ring lytic transglycosylase RlpA family protein [Ornithobacterium rhinotracheale]|uniref:Probable endolytic peptidoglycan transglycosylase RlpA n=1 Tax=Ornithobacterium rhinotracheale (strain ATCC 51463 / DSM 15997 / CCUG 23171 / CIP 104009 / LMG 9086) TaxID=867902 RepID=I3ZYK7_ORNRL|nr:septal ring lytic transglycosylase RlpA family protein [Ornithobacterium rhinotracheale]AFL96791.1 rare lipoprotein A [Ornithobacterium rhinotracheale DSM 15997]